MYEINRRMLTIGLLCLILIGSGIGLGIWLVLFVPYPVTVHHFLEYAVSSDPRAAVATQICSGSCAASW